MDDAGGQLVLAYSDPETGHDIQVGHVLKCPTTRLQLAVDIFAGFGFRSAQLRHK